MKNLPKHLQEKINAYEAKHKAFFGYTTQEQADKINKLQKTACDFHPVHALVK